MRRLWLPAVSVLAAALVLSTLEGAALHVRHALFGNPVAWGDALIRPLPHWLTMALLAPLAIGLSLRFRVRPGRWGALAVHAAGALVFSVSHIALAALAYQAWLHEPQPVFSIVRGELLFDIALELLSYTVLVTATHAWLWHDDARRGREAAARAEADLAQARLRLLRSQLQPHVLFNTLQAISTLALRNDGGAVVTALARLSDVLRAALDSDGGEEVPLARELEVTDSYLEIQRLRLGDQLGVRLDVEPGTLDARVPPLLLQPLVENAVRHGLAGGRAGVVTVRACRAGGRLELVVADDGAGTHGEYREGTGLRVTRERLRALYGDAQSLVVESGPGRGTTVRVSIPCHGANGAGGGAEAER